MKGFSLSIEPGETVALVGSSGSGKSTIVKLVERFYDPISGVVKFDGKDIKSLNVRSLREQIGMVAQEPVLFDTSIKKNLFYGLSKDQLKLPKDKINELIEQACISANIWEFIMGLPKGLETNLGEDGALISGGQKQRICIARAIISNPKILILDEATSVLDTGITIILSLESEKLLQEALEKATKGRTAIIIAHRLSTVKNANKIIVMSKGRIMESGVLF